MPRRHYILPGSGPSSSGCNSHWYMYLSFMVESISGGPVSRFPNRILKAIMVSDVFVLNVNPAQRKIRQALAWSFFRHFKRNLVPNLIAKLKVRAEPNAKDNPIKL